MEPYSNETVDKIPELLKAIVSEGLTEEQKEKLIDFIPKNNWDRYFSEILDCDSANFKKRWEKLYEVRCKIAHNSILTYQDYKNGKKLCDDVNQILTEAIQKLGSVTVPKEEVENIVKSSIAIEAMADLPDNDEGLKRNSFPLCLHEELKKRIESSLKRQLHLDLYAKSMTAAAGLSYSNNLPVELLSVLGVTACRKSLDQNNISENRNDEADEDGK